MLISGGRPPGDWHGEAPKWFYYDKGSSTIECTVDVWTDDLELNTRIGTWKDLTVERAEIDGKNEFSLKTDTTITGHLYTTTNPAVVDWSGNQVGMHYRIESAASSVASHFRTGGDLTDAQLIIAHWDDGHSEVSTDGEYWLDDSFPYNNVGSIVGTSSGKTIADLEDFDSPHFGSAPLAIVHTGYTMNMIYKPSTPGSSYIPLSQFVWTWDAQSGITLGQPDGYPIVRTVEFPEWDHVLVL